MSNNIDSAVQTYMDSAQAGLWGMALHALLLEGKGSALASLDKIAAGTAFVEVQVLFTRRGMAVTGEFCGHGERSNLFTATMNQPDAPDAPPAPTELH